MRITILLGLLALSFGALAQPQKGGLPALQQQVDENSAAIGELADDIPDISDLETEVDANSAAISALEQQADDNSTGLGTLSDEVMAIGNDLFDLESEVDANSSAISGLETQLEGGRLYRRGTTVSLEDVWNGNGIVGMTVRCRTDGAQSSSWDEVVSAGFTPIPLDGSMKLLASRNNGRGGFHWWNFTFDVRERANQQYKGRIELYVTCLDRPPYNSWGGQVTDWYEYPDGEN